MTNGHNSRKFEIKFFHITFASKSYNYQKKLHEFLALAAARNPILFKGFFGSYRKLASKITQQFTAVLYNIYKYIHY